MSWGHGFAQIVATMLVFLLAGSASAQPFEPTEEEFAHNAAAMALAKTGDFEAAAAEEQKAVAVRGLNVFLLNLGRYQQRAGRCADAVESYTQAMSAPPVIDPPAKLVRETAQEYISQLADECPGRVKLTCLPADMSVTASRLGDTDATAVACGSEVALPGGRWRFEGSYGTETTEHFEDVRIAKVYEVRLQISTPVAATTVAAEEPASLEVAPQPSQDKPRRGLFSPPVLSVVGGVMAILGGAFLDQLPASAHNGQLDGMDFVPLGLYIGGAALIVIGLVLW